MSIVFFLSECFFWCYADHSFPCADNIIFISVLSGLAFAQWIFVGIKRSSFLNIWVQCNCLISPSTTISYDQGCCIPRTCWLVFFVHVISKPFDSESVISFGTSQFSYQGLLKEKITFKLLFGPCLFILIDDSFSLSDCPTHVVMIM